MYQTDCNEQQWFLLEPGDVANALQSGTEPQAEMKHSAHLAGEQQKGLDVKTEPEMAFTPESS